VVAKDGSSVTFKGTTTIHGPDDEDWEELKAWFYSRLSGTADGPNDPGARAMRSLLDSPNRVILETRAEPPVTFDWEKFGAALGDAVAAGVGAESPAPQPQ
jgi:hypothetical protein